MMEPTTNTAIYYLKKTIKEYFRNVCVYLAHSLNFIDHGNKILLNFPNLETSSTHDTSDNTDLLNQEPLKSLAQV